MKLATQSRLQSLCSFVVAPRCWCCCPLLAVLVPRRRHWSKDSICQAATSRTGVHTVRCRCARARCTRGHSAAPTQAALPSSLLRHRELDLGGLGGSQTARCAATFCRFSSEMRGQPWCCSMISYTRLSLPCTVVSMMSTLWDESGLTLRKLATPSSSAGTTGKYC